MTEKVFVIYNPNSTGDALSNAAKFKADLEKRRSDITCQLLPTEHAGHAEELAKEHSAGPSTVIVSSSGDGGLHEVVNGILHSSSATTIAGVLPSGNANDHYHSRHSGDVVSRISTADAQSVDVLKVAWDDHVRYAHSYIGLGITADIGHSLTKAELNRISELCIAAKHLFRRRVVRLKVDGRSHSYDSIIYAVVPQMSKYFDTGAENHRKPGEFIVVTTRARGFWHIFTQLLRRVGSSNEPTRSAKQQSFTTLRPTKMQCDGEIYELPTGTSVTISCEPNLLHEIV